MGKKKKKKKAIAAFLKTQLQLLLTYLKRVYSRVFKNAAIAFQSVQLTQGSIAAFFETRLQETFELRFRYFVTTYSCVFKNATIDPKP